MSRYYDISIGDKNWRSHDKNQLQKIGALKITLHGSVTSFHQPAGDVELSIWGLGLLEITKNIDYSGKLVRIILGMGRGLPFSNPKNIGLSLTGVVKGFAYPKIEGINQYLNFMIIPGAEWQDSVSISWQKGEKLSDVLSRALNGKDNVEIKIREDLAMFDGSQNIRESTAFHTKKAFGEFLYLYSKEAIKEESYPGISVYPKDNGFLITDNSVKKTPIKLNAYEFIEMPSFQQPGIYNAPILVRGDIKVGDDIEIPDRMQIRLNQDSIMLPRNMLSLKGVFNVLSITYNINSRGNSGQDYIMILNIAKNIL